MSPETSEERSRAARKSVKIRRAELRLAKRKLALEESRAFIDALKVLVSNPAIGGVMAFFLVVAVRKAGSLGTSSSSGGAGLSGGLFGLGSPLNGAFQQFLSSFGSTGPLGQLLNQIQTSVTGAQGAIGWDALELAIITYIGTSGLSTASITEALAGAATLLGSA